MRDEWCPENDGAYRSEMAALHRDGVEQGLHKAEAERDTQEADFAKSIAIEVASRLKAEAERGEERENAITWMNAYQAVCKERGESLAQVAMAYELAARHCFDKTGARLIRALTPAHAQSALEAYGREKVRVGMRKAAEIAAFHVIYDDTPAHSVRDGIEAEILAEMETLK